MNVDDINGNDDEEINLVDFGTTNVFNADGECELEPEMVLGVGHTRVISQILLATPLNERNMHRNKQSELFF